MNNVFSLEQISETGNLGGNLILRLYKLDLMARFMEVKSINPKLKHNQIANVLGYSISTLHRYRNDINMLSSYRIPPNSHRKQKFQKQNSMIIQIMNMTLNDLK